MNNVIEFSPKDDLPQVMSLQQFIADFGDGLLDAVRSQHPPIYRNQPDAHRDRILGRLLRQPYPAQREVVQAVTRLLVDQNEPAAVINGEMGTGKTMMAIGAAACLHSAGLQRTLIISPPHLVYKWRREIKETVPEARVWVLNGPDTLKQLLRLRVRSSVPSCWRRPKIDQQTRVMPTEY
jgi:SNF2 family DNA or RNA helicase